MIRKKIIILCSLLCSLIVVNNAYSAGLKKVIILDFINIDKKPNYMYLEESITESVRDLLKKKFAFQEMRKSKLDEIRKTNFIYRGDYYTRSASMNLGLLAKQDVVISGGFRIEEDKNSSAEIVTQVRIYDISKKKIISSFSIKGPADNRIWNSINEISQRIATEAKSILPNKDEWKQSGISDDLPIFENVTMGFRGGWGTYFLGFADSIEMEQPVLMFSVRANMPFIWEKLAIEANLNFFWHTPRENEIIEQFTFNIQNYLIGGFLALDLNILDDLQIHPKLGGGYAIQTIEISGSENKSLNNSFPFAGCGVDLTYEINSFLYIVIGEQILAEFEDGEITLFNSATAGINLKF